MKKETEGLKMNGGAKRRKEVFLTKGEKLNAAKHFSTGQTTATTKVEEHFYLRTSFLGYRYLFKYVTFPQLINFLMCIS
jgi:hypothetical protein